jgi:hypothetical protein
VQVATAMRNATSRSRLASELLDFAWGSQLKTRLSGRLVYRTKLLHNYCGYLRPTAGGSDDKIYSTEQFRWFLVPVWSSGFGRSIGRVSATQSIGYKLLGELESTSKHRARVMSEGDQAYCPAEAAERLGIPTIALRTYAGQFGGTSIVRRGWLMGLRGFRAIRRGQATRSIYDLLHVYL